MRDLETPDLNELNQQYSKLFNEQDYATRVLNIIISEFAEVALLQNQVKDIQQKIRNKYRIIKELNKNYLSTKR